MAATPFDVFETADWPRVKVRFLRTPTDDSEIVRFQDRMCGMLHLALHGSAHVPKGQLKVMFFIDNIVGATIMQQLKAAEVIHMVAPLVKQGAIKATAIVVSSDAARALLTYILSLAPLTSPNQVFDNEVGADAWLDTQ